MWERAQKKGPSRSLLKVLCRIKSNPKKTKLSRGSFTLAFRATKSNHDLLLGRLPRKRTFLVACLRFADQSLDVSSSLLGTLPTADVKDGSLLRVDGLVGNRALLVNRFSFFLGGERKQTKCDERYEN